MSLTLPNPRSVFIPEPPREITDPVMVRYLTDVMEAVMQMHQRLFDNDYYITSIINTGTSGSFVDSDGNTITVADGLITDLA